MEVAVESRRLVRVLAVTQVLQFDEAAVALAGEATAAAVRLQAGEVVADGGVVLGDAVEGRHRQRELGFFLDATGLQFSQYLCVLRGVGEHRHVFPVFGGRAHHGRATDVDVFNRILQGATGFGHSGFKGVEVDHQEVDGRDVVLFNRRHMFGMVAPCQQAAVDHGMQGFHATIEHLWKTGVVSYFGDGKSSFAQELGCAASGQQLNAKLVQLACEFEDAGFVGDGEEGMHGSVFFSVEEMASSRQLSPF